MQKMSFIVFKLRRQVECRLKPPSGTIVVFEARMQLVTILLNVVAIHGNKTRQIGTTEKVKVIGTKIPRTGIGAVVKVKVIGTKIPGTGIGAVVKVKVIGTKSPRTGIGAVVKVKVIGTKSPRTGIGAVVKVRIRHANLHKVVNRSQRQPG